MTSQRKTAEADMVVAIKFPRNGKKAKMSVIKHRVVVHDKKWRNFDIGDIVNLIRF